MNTPTRLRGSAWKQFAGLSAAVLLAHTATAATLTFNTNADYDNNFYEVANGAELNTNVGGYLRKINKPSAPATVAIYNTHATGGTGGQGGTAGGSPLDTFGDVTLQANFLHTGNNIDASTGVGFFTKIDALGTSGYLAIFRLISTTKADFRLFDTSSLTAVGTQIGTTQTFTGTFAKDTYYTANLTVTDVGANVRFDASLFTNGGTQIESTITLTDTTSAVTGLGQVGLRAGSGEFGILQIDNFSVTSAIPEPNTFALIASGGALGLALLRRKRTQR